MVWRRSGSVCRPGAQDCLNAFQLIKNITILLASHACPLGFLGCGHRLHILGMKLGTPKAMYSEGESFCVARGLACMGAGKAQLQGQCTARDACIPETEHFRLKKDRTGGRKFCCPGSFCDKSRDV